VARGGYILREASGGKPQLILIATGSELQLAFAAAETLEGEGITSRVVSLPCWERFDAQEQAYRDNVLPPSVRKRVSVEVGVSLGWERWVGDEGAIIGLDHFGASAPAGTIFEKFGFTADRVTDVARRVVRDGLRGRIATVDGGHFGKHPTIGSGEAGVGRSGTSDPGHS
jgi:transketolase